MISKETFKVVLLGDRSTGKTCLTRRYFSGQFNENERSTIGSAFHSKAFGLDDREYIMGVWDTTGEERWRSICALYYRGASAAILCYDCTLENSFRQISYWLDQLRAIQEPCSLYVCATKCDLLDVFEARPTLSYVESFAVENNAKFFLTSSRTGYNVEALFRTILEDYIASSPIMPKIITELIRLPSNQRLQKQRKLRLCC